MSQARLVILDRDGVINEDTIGEYVKTPEEWIPIPGSLEAIARLSQAGIKVIVASNQSGLARELFTIDALLRIHEKMERLLAENGGAIDAIFFCPHSPRQRCSCRKPKPGLLIDIAQRYRADLSTVPVVGDKASDIDAALAAGARPVLVRTGYGEQTLNERNRSDEMPVYADLAAFADTLLVEQALDV